MESYYFSQFTRVNEAVHPESLKDTELTVLENMRLDDKIAAASSRKGFDRYNQEADTTGSVISLFDVKDKDNNNYLLAQINGSLRKSLNGTGAYSTIKGSLSDDKLKMAIYGDNFFFTNGNDKPFYTDLTSANTYDLSIERPDVTTMIAYNNNSGYGTTTYTHRRYLVQFITASGQVSNVSVYFETRFYEDLEEGGTRQIDIIGIPVPTDPRVVSKKLYRTKANELSTFYLLATLDAANPVYTDTIFDSGLLLEESIEYITDINTSNYITVNNERLFLGDINKQYTNRVIAPGYSEDTHIIETTGGNIAAGDYVWGLTYVDTDGNESELTKAVSATVSTGSSTVVIDDICMPVVRVPDGYPNNAIFNDSIKSIKLYRTKVGTTSPFYFVKEEDVNDVADNMPLNPYWVITDDLADSSLTVEYSGPGSTDLKSTIIYSNLYSPLEFPELNLIQIYPDDNDPITGIFDDDNGIIVFKERSICKLYTNGDPVNWQVAKLVSDVGCDEPESIYKYEGIYYFFYKKRPYVFDGRNIKNIGESRKYTFNSVTSVKGATFWHNEQFYIMAVTIGSNYYLMIYDTKLDGWYKWTISKADDIITRLYGDDKDTLLFGGSNYVTYYNESIDYDNENGSRKDITVRLQTKDYRVDGFVNQRLWMLYIDYVKRLNRVTDNIIFTLSDPDKPSTTLNYNDNNSSVRDNKFKIPTDAMIGIMKRARTINFSFAGVSLDKFVNGRLDYMPEGWGVERRDSGEITGLGVSHGSEAGVSD